MSKRSLLAMLTVFALMTGVVASSAATQSTPSGDSGPIIFTMGLTGDMVSPNPFKACCTPEYEMMFLNYDQLFNFSKDTLEATSGLASFPPEKSADGKTWTFQIRDDATWSDGVPVTAKDVAFTFNFIWKNHLAIFYQYLGYPASFTAPNDTTFVWTMDKPTTSPLSPPWLPIVPEHIWSKLDGKDAQVIKEFKNVPAVGSGPFNLTEWKPGQYWTMDANKDYWGGAPHIDQIIFKTFDNPEALKLALINGEVDAADDLPPAIFEQLQGQPNIVTNESAGNYFDNLAFNFEGTADPSLQDLKVRQAIHYSMDKQAIVDRVALGHASPGTSVELPMYSQWAWQPDPSQTVGYDPEKAKQLLDEAGYKDVNGDGFRETPSGEPWSMEVLTISDLTYSVAEGKLIVGWMNDVGIKTTIKTVSENKAYDIWADQTFDMYIWGWGNEPDPDYTLSLFTKGQCLWWSDGCYYDPAYEEMYKQQHQATDLQQRIELVDQMQQYLYEQVPEIVLMYTKDLQAYRSDRFTGYQKQPSPTGSLFFAFGSEIWLGVKPVSEGQAAAGSGSSIPVWVWIALVALVVVLGGAFMLRRGKASADIE